jgi:hypothetical protein
MKAVNRQAGRKRYAVRQAGKCTVSGTGGRKAGQLRQVGKQVVGRQKWGAQAGRQQKAGRGSQRGAGG